MDRIIKGGGNTGGGKDRHGSQQHAHRPDHRERDHAVGPFGPQHARHTKGDGQQRGGHQPDIKQPLRDLKIGGENQRVEPDDTIGPDLGHDREQRRHGGRCLAIAGGQPEMQRQDRGLDRKDQQQQHRRNANTRTIARIKRRHTHRQIGHVQRACLGIDRAKSKEEQGRAQQVIQHILRPRAQTPLPARVDH